MDFIEIKSGTMSMHFVDDHHLAMDKGPLSDIRIRSRKSTVSDCSCFLRPGIDVCVLSAPQSADNSDDFRLEPVSVPFKLNYKLVILFFMRSLNFKNCKTCN